MFLPGEFCFKCFCEISIFEARVIDYFPWMSLKGHFPLCVIRMFVRKNPYTLTQTKRNFSEVAFFGGRSVGRWTLGQMSLLQCSKVPLPYILPKKKCNIQKNYRISISSNGISAISWKSWEDVYSGYWVSWENRLTFFDGVFCLLLPGAFPLMDMTWGHWPWSRVTIKILEIKVTFLLGKSVYSQKSHSMMHKSLE